MKVYNGDIYTAKDSLKELMEIKLPVLVSYKLAKMASKFNEQLRIIEEVRLKLLAKYGTTNETGYVVVPEGTVEYKNFYNDFVQLLNQEVELDIEKVSLPTDDLNVEPKILMNLEKFVEI